MGMFNTKIPPATVRRRGIVNEGDVERALLNLYRSTMGMVGHMAAMPIKDYEVVPHTVADPLTAAISDAQRVLGLLGMLPK